MAKQQKKVSSVHSKSTEVGFSLSKLIPEKFQTPALLIVLLVLIMIFFAPIMFEISKLSKGKKGDVNNSKDKEQAHLLLLGIYTAVGISLHNFPEGIAVFMVRKNQRN